MKITLSKDHTKIAYETFGSGPALIFVTGAICHRSFMPVRADAKEFAKIFTVYNYDRRGRGTSTDTKPYQIAREIEDIEALIDEAGGSAFLYGHSSGAVLALEAALKLPAKVPKVFIYDASYVSSASEKEDYAKLNKEVLALLQEQKNAAALRKFLIGIGMPRIFVYALPLIPGWKKLKALAPTLEYDMLLTKDLPPTEHLSKLQVPLQIAFGEKSPATIHKTALLLSAAIPKAQLFEVKNQDHMASAKALLPLLKDFLTIR